MIVDRPAITVVSKDWGFEKIITNTDNCCGKLLYIVKDKKCSLHYHKRKDETLYVQNGKVIIYYCDNIELIKNMSKNIITDAALMALYDCNKPGTLSKLILKRGENFYIPPTRLHQILAIEDTEIFEFSSKHFDSDIYRIVKGN